MPTEGIFDLRLYSIHDGPGIRTTVFFKGCPLQCAWCHNPESQHFVPELLLLPNRCIGCGACMLVCPNGAISRKDGAVVTDRSRCTVCGECVPVCFADARQLVGSAYDIDDAMALIDADARFYGQSGGGVTFSGGEPMNQPDLLLPLAKRCKANGYHTALDTSGYAPWTTFEQILPYIDLVLYDLKLMDEARHQHFTGVSNKLILDNLRKLAAMEIDLWLRLPLVPGITDTEENLSATAAFLNSLPRKLKLSILLYHNVAAAKYTNLGIAFSLPDVPAPDQSCIDEVLAFFTKAGITVQQGG